MDVDTAFLNGTIDKEIYMVAPQGFKAENGKVWKLKKSLYGLKQASRIWNQTISKTLISYGYTQCESDPCLFVNGNSMILVYVDLMGEQCRWFL